MRIDAVGVTSSDMKITIDFYTLLGFKFEPSSELESHVEPITSEGETRLMIDTVEFMLEHGSQRPTPSNHSHFAVLFDSAKEVDDVVEQIRSAGYSVAIEPFDAFWGQRYAIVEDPDGYKVDLFAYL